MMLIVADALAVEPDVLSCTSFVIYTEVCAGLNVSVDEFAAKILTENWPNRVPPGAVDTVSTP